MMTDRAISKFTKELDKCIEFRRNNTNDPHGIDTAVLVALEEVKAAWLKANYFLPEQAKAERKDV
jgi:hypothetical protein